MTSSLSPPQQYIHDTGMLSSGFHALLQLPTGAGKTYMGEQSIAATLKAGRRAIYLTPIRALADELYPRWSEQYQDHRTGIFTGDYGKTDKPYPVPLEQAELLIMTPERLDACTRNWRSNLLWMSEVDLVIVDELHLLGDEGRGSRLEGTLSRFMRINPFARILGLSATLGNLDELGDWLGGVTYRSEWRPVPLEWRFATFRNAKDKPSIMLDEVRYCVAGGGQSIVFVQSRKRAEDLAAKAKEVGLRAEFHHAGLTHDRRRRVELAFRSGDLDVLCATATLELGLNLPCRQVILYDMQRYTGDGWKPLSVVNAWQRAGRAGRRGFDDRGEVVAIMPAWDRKTAKYEMGDFEPIMSGLASTSRLAEQIVVEVSSGLCRTREQLCRLFDGSLAARQKKLPKVKQVIDTMERAGMIEEVREEDGPARLRATKLGRIACRHLLSPESVLLMKSVLDRTAMTEDSSLSLSYFDYLLVVAACQDCGPILQVGFEELDHLAGLLSTERSGLLQEVALAEEVLGVSGKRLLGLIKTALALRCLTRVGGHELVAESVGCYTFEVAMLQESAERLLLAMAEVFAGGDKEFTGECTGGERVAALARMVGNGLDESKATLTLVEGIGPKYAGRLAAIGINDIEDLANAESVDLVGVRGLSEDRAARWIAEAEEIVKGKSAYYFDDAEVSVPHVGSEWPGWGSDIDPYRLRRSMDLSVDGPRAPGNVYLVQGGLDPHLVTISGCQVACDCPDHEKGNCCKHILAVRMYRGDKELWDLARKLSAAGGRINLLGLWGNV